MTPGACFRIIKWLSSHNPSSVLHLYQKKDFPNLQNPTQPFQTKFGRMCRWIGFSAIAYGGYFGYRQGKALGCNIVGCVGGFLGTLFASFASCTLNYASFNYERKMQDRVVKDAENAHNPMNHPIIKKTNSSYDLEEQMEEAMNKQNFVIIKN